MTPDEEVEYGFALAEWDWVVTSTWAVLHAPREVDDSFGRDAQGMGVTECGVDAWLQIPGVFTRMGAPRCKTCCRVTGFPQGTGSPKNDKACRPLVEARLEGAA